MKIFKFAVFLCAFMIFGTIKVYAGNVYLIEYSPANPVAGQPVTFTLLAGDQTCYIESVVPDAVNNPGNLLALPAMYSYPSPGTYHVALDIEYDSANPMCTPAIRESKGSKRTLTGSFQMGPVGGPYSPAVMQGQIFCSPITIAAAAPIPTMGQWSIIILFILTSILGVVFAMNHITSKA